MVDVLASRYSVKSLHDKSVVLQVEITSGNITQTHEMLKLVGARRTLLVHVIVRSLTFHLCRMASSQNRVLTCSQVKESVLVCCYTNRIAQGSNKTRAINCHHK